MFRQQEQQQQVATPKPPPPSLRTTTPLPAPPAAVVVPVPAPDAKQQHILKLIRASQYNQAFEYALSASDLSLVLYLCETIRPAELFALKPCPLQTPVLLSLIQQLAANLTTHQELKYRFVISLSLIQSHHPIFAFH